MPKHQWPNENNWTVQVFVLYWLVFPVYRYLSYCGYAKFLKGPTHSSILYTADHNLIWLVVKDSNKTCNSNTLLLPSAVWWCPKEVHKRNTGQNNNDSLEQEKPIDNQWDDTYPKHHTLGNKCIQCETQQFNLGLFDFPTNPTVQSNPVQKSLHSKRLFQDQTKTSNQVTTVSTVTVQQQRVFMIFTHQAVIVALLRQAVVGQDRLTGQSSSITSGSGET